MFKFNNNKSPEDFFKLLGAYLIYDNKLDDYIEEFAKFFDEYDNDLVIEKIKNKKQISLNCNYSKILDDQLFVYNKNTKPMLICETVFK